MSSPTRSMPVTSLPASPPSTSAPSTDPNPSRSSAMTSVSAGTVNGDAESSKMASTPNSATSHAINLTNHIFTTGYIEQQWTDIQLIYFGQAIHLHRVILARSPYLVRLMAGAKPGSTVHMSFHDSNIILDAVHICLQHLYNPTFQLVNPANARAVLITAYLFEGMPEMVYHAYETMRESLTSSNVLEYVQWLGQPSMRYNGRYANGDVEKEGGVWEGDEGRYGEWTGRVKDDVIEYLTVILPTESLDTTASLGADPRLLSIYTHLPYPLLKVVLESPDLPLGTMKDRFEFAKRVLAHRKSAAGGKAQTEETAVLAFADEGGMKVYIARKPRKGKTLWKVEGGA